MKKLPPPDFRRRQEYNLIGFFLFEGVCHIFFSQVENRACTNGDSLENNSDSASSLSVKPAASLNFFSIFNVSRPICNTFSKVQSPPNAPAISSGRIVGSPEQA